MKVNWHKKEYNGKMRWGKGLPYVNWTKCTNVC